MQRVIFSTLLLCLGGAVFAQSEARRDPSDPQAGVPAVQYRSAFSEYQPFRDPEIGKWREANDQMKELGGHRGHVAKPGNGGTKPGAQPEAGRAQEPPAGGHAEHHR